MDIFQPISLFDLSQEIEVGGGISWFDYLCQQWFRKLIVSYLHQYQTFLVILNVRYYSIVCHFCSRQPVYKRERNPKQGITSCFKWLSDIISRFTECSRSPNSLCGSSMKTIATEMLKCMNSFNPTTYRSRKSPMCWLPIVHNLAIESYVPFQISSSTIKTLCFLHLFKALHP